MVNKLANYIFMTFFFAVGLAVDDMATYQKQRCEHDTLFKIV